MDRDTLQNWVQAIDRTRANYSEIASILVVPLLLTGVVIGFLVARWVFRGGLSRPFISTAASSLRQADEDR